MEKELSNLRNHFICYHAASHSQRPGAQRGSKNTPVELNASIFPYRWGKEHPFRPWRSRLPTTHTLVWHLLHLAEWSSWLTFPPPMWQHYPRCVQFSNDKVIYPYCAPALAIGSAFITYQKSIASKCFQPFPGIIPDNYMTNAQQQISTYTYHENPNIWDELAGLLDCSS